MGCLVVSGTWISGEGSRMSANQKRILWKKIARMSCFAGCALVMITQLAFLATALYETVVPPTDMHLPGLLTAVMMLYVSPLGVVLFVVGGLVWVRLYFLDRKGP